MQDDILKQVNDYYTVKIKEHGATPKGVDWNGEESQNLRFENLLRILPQNTKTLSILDYGCGYGALCEFLSKRNHNFKYTGFDISEEMINQAKIKSAGSSANWYSDIDLVAPHDFTIASGIFNVKQSISDSDWLEYILTTLKYINSLSKEGFAVNLLTKYSDQDYKKNYLFYADPEFLFAFCKQHFSKNIALLHDYGLYEFTLLIRKNIA